jgi:hypothetical protein
VSAIYCVWQAYRRQEESRKQRILRLRERIAFMLWTAADRVA